jgi:hypothetical protein
MDVLLQIFLFINVLALGAAATIAVQHAYTYIMHRRYPERDHNALKDSPLPQKLKEELIKESRERFQDALDASVDSLQHDLKIASDRISQHLEQLGNDRIHKEAERYHGQLEQLYVQVENQVEEVTADAELVVAEAAGPEPGGRGDLGELVVAYPRRCPLDA